MVTFDLHCRINTPQEFDEVRKLYQDTRWHYDTHYPRRRYLCTINDAPGGGYVASTVRIEPRDWRLAFTRQLSCAANDGETDP